MKARIDPNPRLVYREFDADSDKLYGPIELAIAYLQKIATTNPGATLSERWDGYEDMHLVFKYTELETPEEVKARIDAHAQKVEREKEAAKKAIERAEKIAQLNKLKRELGFS